MTSIGFSFASSWKRPAFAIGLIASILSVAGFLLDKEQFFTSYLQSFLFVFAAPMGCFGLLMVHNLTGGNWGWTIRPFLQSGLKTLPLMAVLFIPIVLGMKELYSWTNAEVMHHSPLLQSKAAYLNVNFWLVRAAFYFVTWLSIGHFLNKALLPSPQAGDEKAYRRVQRISALGMLTFMLTASFAAIDWVMSVEPHWFSSIFGVLVIVGYANTAFCVVIFSLIWMHQKHSNPWFNQKNLHDLGKFLFMTVMLWGYISLSQFLIIWSANLPEETFWYWQRGQGIWYYISTCLVVFQFIVPFILLMSKTTKTSTALLLKVIPFMLCVRLLEQVWLISPTLRNGRFPFHWLDVVLPVALGSIWVGSYLHFLSSNSGVPMTAQAAHGHHGPQDK